MSETHEELAGIVDLFGALTPTELERALSELAFKQGEETNAAALSGAVETAIEEYYLVEYDPTDADGNGADDLSAGDLGDDDHLLVVGPVAFPTLPENAEDLPHILDVPERSVDREVVGRQVASRLLTDAARAVNDDDADRIDHLLDVSYDLEVWAPVEVDDVQARLHDALEE
ncbi:DUF7109 family protein [Salinirubrum litoreum]|uniref:Uncharacterized protein n=1 Tax=Salinirubrum litoreum TaxID=1126234 RepID=A0ABD5RA18_9EURY|nr:hypothetical protein [Salinirubrum litoreum]